MNFESLRNKFDKLRNDWAEDSHVDFQNLFPVSLSNLQFDATISDVEYITAEVVFKHQQFFLRDKSMKRL